MMCKFLPGNPQSWVIWKRNKMTISNSSATQYKLGPLEIENNNDVMECEVYNEYTRKYGITLESLQKQLIVEYFPLITFNVEDTVSTTEGQNMSVLCSATGNPAPQVSWVIHEKDKTMFHNDSDLQWTYIDRSANGTYKCVARSLSAVYGDLKAEKSLEVFVHYAPDVEVIQSNPDPVESMYLILQCNATGYPAVYKYSGWQHSLNGVVIREGRSLSTSESGRTLTLNFLNYMDMGNYSCSVNNGIESKQGILTQNATRLIKIRVAPTQLNEMPADNTYASEKGGNISVEIIFITEPGITTSLWWNITSNAAIHSDSQTTVTVKEHVTEASIYGQKVNITGNTYRAALRLQDFQEYMQGYYSLIVNNGYTRKNFTVRIVTSDLKTTNTEFNITSVVGGICGTVAGSFLVLIAIMYVKRRYFADSKGTDENDRRQKLTTVKMGHEDDDGLHENILYQSAGPTFDIKTDKIGLDYAVVHKEGNKLKIKADEKVQETTLYSDVKKTTKHGKRGDLYANVSKTRTGTAKLKNKNSLVYADLDLKPAVDAKIIHGFENKTNYVDIDFTKKADPLPTDDSDEDEHEIRNEEQFE